jgi:hypothetical protein
MEWKHAKGCVSTPSDKIQVTLSILMEWKDAKGLVQLLCLTALFFYIGSYELSKLTIWNTLTWN